MKKTGIDCGASSIKLVCLEDGKTVYRDCREHFGNPHKTLKDMLCKFKNTVKEMTVVSFCGCCAPEIHDKRIIMTDDIPAVTEGCCLICPQAKSVIDIGSRNARFISISEPGKPPVFSVNEHCAGGTGSFFENQMSRLGMDIKDYSSLVKDVENIPRISGRCAVFAKTDIIHRQQEGTDIKDILLGLCYAMIRNYKAVIVKKLPVNVPVVLCGGTALNTGVIRAVKEVFGLDDNELIIPDDFRFAGAFGAASAAEKGEKITTEELIDIISSCSYEQYQHSEKLDCSGVYMTDPKCDGVLSEEGAFLGIDIGSTSTDLVLVDSQMRLIDFQYLRTSGNSEQAVKNGLNSIFSRFPEIKIRGAGVTGSGRDRIGKMIGADVVKDEITAQAKAAVKIFPDADTVFEIGGQDSKFISLKNGMVSDFRMNKICSAGTGSLAEEQAARLGISLKKFGELALESESPAELGERCTVFIESAVSSAAASGVPVSDIASGICKAIVKNYIHKVAERSLTGSRIVLQGGVAYNPGIVAAFKSEFGEKISVSPYFSISGAYGAALIAAETVCNGNTTFTGFKKDAGLVKANQTEKQIEKNKAFYQRSLDALLEGYDGTCNSEKKTIGVPLVLVIHKLFPMINAFFKVLGFNVVLSSPTNEHTIELAQQYAQGEVCYPVKLIYGHMMELVEKKADYIFMPSVHTMKHEKSGVKHNYGCVYMQTAGRIIADNLNLDKYGIKLISPAFNLDFGKQAMAMSMIKAGEELGFSKPKCMAALLAGSAAVKKYTEAVEKQGRELLSALDSGEKVLVLITRPYDIADPVLNMGIPDLLLERGCKLISLEHLPGHSIDISDEYPNMYWPFGQHIISGAKMIKKHQNLYAVYLTNHGCGPDTMLTHIFRREMGDKPYLQIEVDEHYSPVGIITRIEAFLNSLEQHKPVISSVQTEINDVEVKKFIHLVKPQKERVLWIPDFGYYSDLTASYLREEYGTEVKKADKGVSYYAEKGRFFTSAKEYVTFTSLLGTVLDIAEKTEQRADILIPENEGAEADGVFSRVISAIADEKGMSDRINIISPMMEQLLQNAANPEKLFRALLAGDIIMSAPSYIRKEIFCEEIPDEEGIKALAQKAACYSGQGRVISVSGTPMSVFSVGIKVLSRLESDGYDIRYMPFSEYMWFLWNDASEHRTLPLLRRMTTLMAEVHKILGGRSPFTPDVKLLKDTADEKFAGYAGGNGRYRYAKIVLADNCDAVLNITPRYENTSFIHELSGINPKIPVHFMTVDADNDDSEIQSLRSFLYYI